MKVCLFVMSVRVVCKFVILFFFFQAEDGIRDLVRSRGLGDVYKRQQQVTPERLGEIIKGLIIRESKPEITANKLDEYRPVSYTHLTLPTSDLV